MNQELEDLQYTVKRRFSFGINPQYSESFKTKIADGQIIPLIQEVFRILDWPVVYTDKHSVEAKRKNQWDKLTAKLTITKKNGGRIEVHSKSLEGHLTDLGKNSKRTGLFIALFKKLETEYEADGKLAQLEEEFNKNNNWEDYEVPDQLPPPPKTIEPSLSLTITAAIVIAAICGITLGFLNHNFGQIIGIYELGIGLFVGYFFGLTITKTNFTTHNAIKIIIVCILLTILFISLITEYYIGRSNLLYSNLELADYLKLRVERGLVFENMNTGWIGLVIAWIFQIWFAYIIALYRATHLILFFFINRIPTEVINFTVYHLENGSSISQTRYHLAQKGWKKTSDQDNIFEAISDIFGLQELNRN